jgi:predicted outer membrane repeat protein
MGRAQGAKFTFAAIAWAAAMLLCAPSALAGNFVVDTLADSADVSPVDGLCLDAGGKCSLRAASFEASISPGDDSIGFSVTGTIDTACNISNFNNSHTTITGPGADRLTIRRTAGACSLFLLNGAGDVTMSGLTLTGGGTVSNGGAIQLASASNDLVLRQVALVGNSATLNGGAIFSIGGVTIDQSAITSNMSGNAAIASFGGTLNISRSTITGNKANSASVSAAGIYAIGTQARIDGSTIAANQHLTRPVSALLYDTGSSVRIRDSIFADPIGTAGVTSCATDGGTLTSEGFNLDEDGSCKATAGGDLVGVDAGLAPLGAYGGPTQTLALVPGSPAIDKGSAGAFGGADQRGFPRPSAFKGIPDAPGGDGSDIGAYELTNPDKCAGKKGKSRKRCLCKKKKKKKKRKKCLKKLKGRKR